MLWQGNWRDLLRGCKVCNLTCPCSQGSVTDRGQVIGRQSGAYTDTAAFIVLWEVGVASQISGFWLAGHSPSNERPSNDVGEAAGGAVSGSSAEVDEDDPELSDVLKRSLEEH